MRARKQYRQILLRKVREGGLSFVAGSLQRVAGTWLSSRVRRPVVGPSIATLVITYRCNYACTFCELPQRATRRRKEGLREFDGEEMLRVVRGLKAIRAAGVGITGGEPFLRKDLFDVLGEIARLGMVAHVNTNGHFLTRENVTRLLGSGADSVNISLDAPDAETHNRVRGNPRSYERIVKGIDEIRRRRRGGRPRIGLTSVVTRETVGKALEMTRLARDLGVDSVGFLPIHEYHDGADAAGILRARTFAKRSEAVIAELLEVGGEILENSAGYLSLFPRAFAGKPSGLRCYAPYNSIVVDCYGRVYPCVPFSEIDEPVATIGPGGVSGVWRSKTYAEMRDRLADCQACYWNCHTEMNLLFQGVPREPE